MTNPVETDTSWIEEKERLKHEFELLTDDYALFEDNDKTVLSEKLQLRLAQTKDALHRLLPHCDYYIHLIFGRRICQI